MSTYRNTMCGDASAIELHPPRLPAQSPPSLPKAALQLVEQAPISTVGGIIAERCAEFPHQLLLPLGEIHRRGNGNGDQLVAAPVGPPRLLHPLSAQSEYLAGLECRRGSTTRLHLPGWERSVFRRGPLWRRLPLIHKERRYRGDRIAGEAQPERRRTGRPVHRHRLSARLRG